MGSSTPAGAQIYSNPSSASSSTPPTLRGGGGGFGGGFGGGGGQDFNQNQGSQISGSGPFFSAPGQGLGPIGTPSPGGKGAPPAQNQLPGGTQAGLTPNYDPALGMNAIYAQQNQAPGSAVSSPAPDIVPPSAQPLARQISPLSGFSFQNPFQLGNLGAFASAQSPFGLSPYWSGGGGKRL